MFVLELQSYAAPFGGPFKFCPPSDTAHLKLTKKREQELLNLPENELAAELSPLTFDALSKRGYGINVVIFVFAMIQTEEGQPIKRVYVGCYRTETSAAVRGSRVTYRSKGNVSKIEDHSQFTLDYDKDLDPTKRPLAAKGGLEAIFQKYRQEIEAAKEKARKKREAANGA